MIKRFLIDRLDERSTWRALVALLTLLGIGLSPEQSDAIIAAGIAIGAALEALLPDPAGRMRPQRLPEHADAAELPHATSDQPARKPADPARSDLDNAFGPWGDDR
ncbi:MAG: hypothetical protein VBE63_15335 [Lamprobacter sp.]|uniref:hypothetical protein n=1 Tax=Lamprobacter sp. TaxID=3100796 RepID=UPI002B25D4D8|nr:hypothetical protein [Lamprobacter sp.]MEA3641297.1 hypothetical protein [Lamprobacter sp.]